MNPNEITKKGLFCVRNDASEAADIHIFDEIGDGWFGGITDKDFAALLEPLSGVPLNIHIDSPGGDVFQGIAIGNMLAAHDAPVTGYIKGLAASIASVIAVSVDKLIAPDNTMMMIHDPWTITMGNSRAMRAEADLLDKAKEIILNTYMGKASASRQKLSDLMAGETWLTAEEAHAVGLVDEVTKSGRNPEARASLSRFTGAYNRIPKNLLAASVAAREALPEPERLSTYEEHLRSTVESMRNAELAARIATGHWQTRNRIKELAEPPTYENKLRRQILAYKRGE